jgi:hypothetical protein
VANKSPHELGLQDGAAKALEQRRSSRRKSAAEVKKAEVFIEETLEDMLATLKPDVTLTPEATAQLNAKLKEANEPAKPKRVRKAKGWSITADQIVEARDGQGLSWADVAKVLELGNPGAARRAYTELTGRDHSTSVMAGKRASSGSGGSRLTLPTWDANADRQTVVDRLTGSKIIVKSSLYGNESTEDLFVAQVKRFDDTDPERPAVEFIEGVYRHDAKTGEEYLDEKLSTGAVRVVYLDRIVRVH